MLPASEVSAPLGMRIAIAGVCSNESGIDISSTRTAENDTPEPLSAEAEHEGGWYA